MVSFVYSDGSRVTLDAALSERHAARVTLTKHPVEEGVSPSDHALIQPQAFSVEGVFTNLPLDEQLQRERSSGEFVGQMVDLLFQTLFDREALTVETELRRYTNMMMTSLSMPRTADIGEAVQFSAEFEEVRFVQTQTVQLTPVQTAVPQKPTQKQKQGVKSGREATVAENRSTLNKVNQWVGFIP